MALLMRYIGFITFFDGSHWWMDYIGGWITLVDGLHLWMDYIGGWFTLVDGLHFLNGLHW